MKLRKACGLLFAAVLLLALIAVALPGASAAPRVPAPVVASLAGVPQALALPRWSPYVVGAGIGVLSWLAFLLADHPLGVSTAFARTAGMAEVALRGDKARQRPYYREFPPTIDWEWMLVVGLFLGALTSSLLSGDFGLVWVPDLWASRMGGSVGLRLVAALIGGVLIGFGARLAGGCTSGHGISGVLQLAPSSLIAGACIFIGGIATAFLIYG